MSHHYSERYTNSHQPTLYPRAVVWCTRMVVLEQSRRAQTQARCRQKHTRAAPQLPTPRLMSSTQQWGASTTQGTATQEVNTSAQPSTANRCTHRSYRTTAGQPSCPATTAAAAAADTAPLWVLLPLSFPAPAVVSLSPCLEGHPHVLPAHVPNQPPLKTAKPHHTIKAGIARKVHLSRSHSLATQGMPK